MIRRPEDAVDDRGRTIPAPHTVGEPLPQEPASSAPSVVVLDYGAGNVRSAVRALEEAGARVLLTSDPELVSGADGLLVPGVGAYEAVAEGLRKVGAVRLIERRLMGGRPVLGICVGLQVLFERGVEHGTETEGLGQWPGTVERLDAPIVPHMGWNTVEPPESSVLFRGIEQERFYFVHSYAARSWDMEQVGPLQAPRVTWSVHEQDRFVAAVENGALSATQFHPEKSGAAGARLLANWLGTLPRRGERGSA